MTIPNNALNLLSSSININNTNNEKDKNNNKLKSISPKQKLIIKHKEEISKNENNKKDDKGNIKQDEQNNNISVIKMIANKIINYTINSSFDAPENIKDKKNYASVIQRDEPLKTHDLYFSQQAYQDHQENNIRKNITTERIFTETKKKKSQNENVVLDKSDSPVNYSIEKLISSNRVVKKNIKQKNTSTKNNFAKNNNKSNNKNYNNRYESSKNIDLKNIKISVRNSVSPKKKENKDLTHNLILNNVNNNNESVIFEDEKSEVESKDSKKVKNYISGNKLIIQIANTDINGAKTDSKSKIKSENKQINKSNFNNGNYSSKNVVNDSIKDFKLSNNEKNNIYINKFSKRYISPISQNRGTFKKQNIEKNKNVKKSFKSKDKNKEKEKEKDFFMDNNKKYETFTNRASKLKGNKTSNGNFANINSNNNKNKEISNSKKNIYLTKTYNTNINQNSNGNKKNNNDYNNSSNTLNKVYPGQKKAIDRVGNTEFTWNLQAKDIVNSKYLKTLTFTTSYRMQDSDSYTNVEKDFSSIGVATDKLWIRDNPLKEIQPVYSTSSYTVKTILKRDDRRVIGRYNPFEAFNLKGKLLPIKTMTMSFTFTDGEESSYNTGTTKKSYTRTWPDILIGMSRFEKLFGKSWMSDTQLDLKYNKKTTTVAGVSYGDSVMFGGDYKLKIIKKYDLLLAADVTSTQEYDTEANILKLEGKITNWAVQIATNVKQWRFSLRYDNTQNWTKNSKGKLATQVFSNAVNGQATSDLLFPTGIKLPLI